MERYYLAVCVLYWVLGMSFYGCMTGTLLIFVSALMSIRAENTTSTDQVEKLILHGRRIVCVW
jgi:hypothetical protein